MKAKFATDPAGHVSLEYDATDYDGVTRRITRVFLAPRGGGYVREYLEHGKSPQVCERLSSTGSTLSVTSREKLLDLIRKEYRAMCRSEKKQQNPWS